MLIGKLIVLDVPTGQPHLGKSPLQAAFCRVNNAVTSIPCPADISTQCGIAGTEIPDIVEITLRSCSGRYRYTRQFGALDRQTEIYRILFVQRHAKTHPAADGIGIVPGNRQGGGVYFALIDVEAATDAIVGVVRVGVGQRIHRIDLAGVDLRGKHVAAAEHVGL